MQLRVEICKSVKKIRDTKIRSDFGKLPQLVKGQTKFKNVKNCSNFEAIFIPYSLKFSWRVNFVVFVVMGLPTKFKPRKSLKCHPLTGYVNCQPRKLNHELPHYDQTTKNSFHENFKLYGMLDYLCCFSKIGSIINC